MNDIQLTCAHIHENMEDIPATDGKLSHPRINKICSKSLTFLVSNTVPDSDVVT